MMSDAAKKTLPVTNSGSTVTCEYPVGRAGRRVGHYTTITLSGARQHTDTSKPSKCTRQ